MITLILSTFLEIQDYQKILAIISLVIDIIASIVLVIRVIKTKNMTPKDFEKIVKSVNSNKKTILSAIGEIISQLEKEQKEEQKDEQKNDQKQKKSIKKKEHKEKSEG